MSWSKLIRTPDFFTLANAVFGFTSILLSFRGELQAACYCLFLSMIMDILDGKIARKTNSASEFGKQMDSLADIISFGVAPAILAIAYTNTTLTIVAAIIFFSCALLRLARFNIGKPQKGYTGMPVTVNALTIPLTILLSFPPNIVPIILLLSAGLMVSNIKVPKL